MAKNILKALFADDGDDDDDAKQKAAGNAGNGGADASGGVSPESPGASDLASRPRSVADAFERIAEQNRRTDERLAALEALQKDLLLATKELHDTAKDQLKVLHYIGKFHESSERRGREMADQFRGVPDVLRTLPSATKEQAERLSEIAARLYEKAQDNTVNALRAAQANHQRTVEDLIEKSLGAARKATYAAVICAGAAVAVAIWIWHSGGAAR